MSSDRTQATAGTSLFIRLDRIGDLVLTLPVDESLGSKTVHWWIPKGLSFITENASPRRTALEVDKKLSWWGFWNLYGELSAQSYDRAVVFHAPWWIGLLLWIARVPIRVGVRSQWHSFLFFNRGVRQKRSRAENNELEYNYQLVEAGLKLPAKTLPRRTLALRGSSDLTKFGLTPGSYVVVHPGMAGSARNWPIDRYVEAIRELVQYSRVVVTGTAADSIWVGPLREIFGAEGRITWLDQKLDGTELISVLAGAKTVFAPSTGVIHLAASCSVPTVGLYSPVRVQRALRWGPQGDRTATLEPQVKCPGELQCLGQACPHWDCMTLISAASVLDAAKKI